MQSLACVPRSSPAHTNTHSVVQPWNPGALLQINQSVRYQSMKIWKKGIPTSILRTVLQQNKHGLTVDPEEQLSRVTGRAMDPRESTSHGARRQVF